MRETLFVDCTGYASICLNEGTASGGTKFRGKFQEANLVNKNKRMYPLDVLQRNVEKLQETVEGRGLFGELDHPTDSIVHLANASHIVTKLWWEGNQLMGEGEILNTPMGRILKSCVESGVRVGISSRGVGNGQVDQNGVLVIGESFKLITFDAVADPSTPEAFQRIVKKENLEVEPHRWSETRKATSMNPNLFVGYVGQILEHKVRELKENIKNK